MKNRREALKNQWFLRIRQLNINWNRNSREWLSRAININGRIITNKKSGVLIANLVKNALGIKLNKDEEAAEKDLNVTRRGQKNYEYNERNS